MDRWPARRRIDTFSAHNKGELGHSWKPVGIACLLALKFMVLLQCCLGFGWLGDGWVRVLALAEFLAICVVYRSV